MTEEQQLKLQSFLDGELPDQEAREVAAWVARDADATALLGELRNTRRALANFEPALKLPESREFFWSKIERELQRLEPSSSAPSRPASLRMLLRRLLVPVAGVAVVLVVVIGGLRSGMWKPSWRGSEAEMTVADASAFTYQDYANETTLVWISYPAESEFAKTTVH